MDPTGLGSALEAHGLVGAVAAAALGALVWVTRRYIGRLEASNDRNTRALESLEGTLSGMSHRQELDHREVLAKIEATGQHIAGPLQRTAAAAEASARAAERVALRVGGGGA
ncbi:MAG: hypothetical protein AB7U23_10100 [Dehalococcoidia bacterium]